MTIGKTPPLQPISVGVRDAAKALGLSQSGLYKPINDGKLGCVRVGKRRLVLISELQAFLERATNGQLHKLRQNDNEKLDKSDERAVRRP